MKQAQKLKAELEAALSPFNVQVGLASRSGLSFILVGIGICSIILSSCFDINYLNLCTRRFFPSLTSHSMTYVPYPQPQVEHGLGELEILPKFLHKGSFVRRVLELSVDAHGGLSPDMVLVIGDDVVDEKMFTAAFGHVAAQAAKPPPSRGCVKGDGTEVLYFG